MIRAAAAVRDKRYPPDRRRPLLLVVDGLAEAEPDPPGMGTGIPLGLPAPDALPAVVYNMATSRDGLPLATLPDPHRVGWSQIEAHGADNLVDMTAYLHVITRGPNPHTALNRRPVALWAAGSEVVQTTIRPGSIMNAIGFAAGSQAGHAQRGNTGDGRFTIAGEATTAADALRKAVTLAPRVVIIDIQLPDGCGLDVVRELRTASDTIGIVVLTAFAGDEELFGALEAGASAFVPKSAPAGDVVSAARYAAETPLAFTAADLASAMRRRLTVRRPQLSETESHVLLLLAQGHGTANIAKQTGNSRVNDEIHHPEILKKLGAANRAQALVIASQHDLLDVSASRPDLRADRV